MVRSSPPGLEFSQSNSFNNGIFVQIDGMVMGSPLGPVIAKLFVVGLESMLVPKLDDHVNFKIKKDL